MIRWFLVSKGETENGQALPLMMVILAVALVGVMVVTRLAITADDAARARTAADGAALAGAAEGRQAAEDIAVANGAVLVSFVRRGATVEVVAEVGAARASARARISVVWIPSGG